MTFNAEEIVAALLSAGVIAVGEWFCGKRDGFWPRSWIRSGCISLSVVAVALYERAPLWLVAYVGLCGVVGGPVMTWVLERWRPGLNIRKPGGPHR